MKISTFNMGLLRARIFGRTLIEAPPFVEHRMAALLEKSRDFTSDIYCFQEIFEAGHRDELARAMNADGYVSAFTMRRGLARWGLGDGLMTFSRYPIKSSDFVKFSSATIEEHLVARRGFQITKLDLGSGNLLAVVNLHLTAGGLCSHPESDKVDRIRQRQIEQLLGYLKNEATRRIIITGDFNAGPGVSEGNFRALLDAGFLDAAEIAAEKQDADLYTWTPTNSLAEHGPHASSPPQRIDHVLLDSRSFTNADVLDCSIELDELIVPLGGGVKSTLSDHFGLSVDVKID